jgi:endonuclease/exonuclease/phosphatase family metal-dependent hydrolase
MRLTTWNCHHGNVEQRLALLRPLAPDLVTLQECRRPVLPFSEAIWSGTREVQGIAVASCNPALRLERLNVDVAPTALPVMVQGPVPFLLLALWSHPPYEEFTLAAHRICMAGGCGLPVVVMGDLNITAKSEAIKTLQEEFGLVSAYHAHHKLMAGDEQHPTHYWRRSKTAPWHIDFCLIPDEWVPNLHEVRVGTFEDWGAESDHCPVTVSLDV